MMLRPGQEISPEEISQNVQRIFFTTPLGVLIMIVELLLQMLAW